jgi:hypothetical protein
MEKRTMPEKQSHRRRRAEKGQALISVVIAVSLVVLVLLTTLAYTQLSNKTIARQLTYQGQALNAAEAGITESLSWFRKQNGLVVNFAPKLDLAATPQVNDTECPAVDVPNGCPRAGIVRSYDISKSGNLKGRYEAVIGTAGGTAGVVDITNMIKTGAPAGTVWQLESTGYVWVNNDPTKRFDQSPNAIISKQTVRSQIQRMTINLPQGGAAVFCGKDSVITIGRRAKLKGGTSLGLAYASTVNSVTTTGSTITGTPGGGTYANSTDPYDMRAVFGLTQAELLSLSDVQYSNIANVPDPLPAMNLVVFNGNPVFTQTKPLNGSGIFVVIGNLSISGVTNSNFNGLIYVTGSVVIDNPSSVSGAIIGNASGTNGNVVTIGNGAGSDIAEMDYDPSIINQINTQMGQYRYTREMYWVGK